MEILRANLEKQNYIVFVDNYEMIAGENFKSRLKHAINNSKSAIIVISEESSISEWMAKEYEWMKERKLDDSSFKIIPILIDKFVSPPEEDIYCIDFTKKKYKEAFYDLVCALERKAPKSQIEINIKDIIVPTIDEEKSKELTLGLNHDVITKLLKSTQSNLPIIIINDKNLNIDDEIGCFVKKIEGKFNYVYSLHTPNILNNEESDFLRKIKEESGLVESKEIKYIKNISTQCAFYQSIVNIKDWSNLINKQLLEKENILIIFKIDDNDEFYKEICIELDFLYFKFKKYLKVITIGKSQKNLKNLYSDVNIEKI